MYLYAKNCAASPLNAQIAARLAPWWHTTWREQHLDFAQVPAAPAFACNAHSQVGEKKLDLWNPILYPLCGNEAGQKVPDHHHLCKLIWTFPVPSVPLSDVMPLVLPRIRRQAALTD